jgi:MFS family permease
MRKVGLRLIPFLVLCYFISYVDRVNVGFAALTMNKDLGLSAAAFGIGGGLFFVAYVLLEVPSNLAMEKVGARLWIARIMITWGLVGIGSAFVVGAVSFSVARFLLGAAEAGFFPGVILYLTYWFPKLTTRASSRCSWWPFRCRAFLARLFRRRCSNWMEWPDCEAGNGC